MRKLWITAFSILAPLWVYAQPDTIQKPVAFGDFDHWLVRKIKESFVIGGNEATVYVIAPTDTIVSTDAYVNKSKSPWSSSNVMAKVAGVVKTSVTVFPEKRGNGYSARMDTKLEKVKVLGMVNISVLASGSIFLGRTIEPIRGANDPYKNLDMGIPFTGTPDAVVFDYKAKISPDTMATRATGSGISKVKGRDRAEVVVFLQKRWEDEKGNIFAQRIGTARERFDKTVPDWKNGHRTEIHYGDITEQPYYDESMDLMEEGLFYAMNSKGKMVPVQETCWGAKDDIPTHLIMMFSSGSLGAFTGSLGNSLWVDNVKLEYRK